jgi:glycosyltransferase involved in cell wall biosynthesis
VLLLAGTGACEKSLKVSAVRLGLRDAVRFLGARSDLADLYAAADVVVLASSEESLPNVLLEAGSAGRPVVATLVGGVAEIVVDGETGLLVPPLRARSMADAVVRLLEEPGTAEAMGAAARVRIGQLFSMEREVRETQDLYSELLEGHA